MLEGGLGEEVAFDDVVVEFVQGGAIGVEHSEAVGRVELGAEVGGVGHPQVGGDVGLGGLHLDGQVPE